MGHWQPLSLLLLAIMHSQDRLIWEEGQVRRRGISFFFSIDGIRENSIRKMGIVALLEINFLIKSE